MPRYIIHKDGAWNMYSTVVDDACFESAVTLDELTEWMQGEVGRSGMESFEMRVQRTLENGCSSFDSTLDDVIRWNHSGKDGTNISRDEFIQRYLTL